MGAHGSICPGAWGVGIVTVGIPLALLIANLVSDSFDGRTVGNRDQQKASPAGRDRRVWGGEAQWPRDHLSHDSPTSGCSS